MSEWSFAEPLAIPLIWPLLFLLGLLWAKRRSQELKFQALFQAAQKQKLVSRGSFSSKASSVVSDCIGKCLSGYRSDASTENGRDNDISDES